MSSSLSSLILYLLLCEISDGSRRMYDTSPSRSAIAHDCLHHLIVDDKGLFVVKMDVRIESIRFCRALIAEDMSFAHGTRWTFDDLRQMNVTAGQLFNWFAPVDLIEDYLLGNEMGIVLNCSERGGVWFGARCQHTLDSTSEFHEILWDRFDAKDSAQVDVLSITHGACYEIPTD